jgi:hypothetical protein
MLHIHLRLYFHSSWDQNDCAAIISRSRLTILPQQTALPHSLFAEHRSTFPRGYASQTKPCRRRGCPVYSTSVISNASRDASNASADTSCARNTDSLQGTSTDRADDDYNCDEASSAAAAAAADIAAGDESTSADTSGAAPQTSGWYDASDASAGAQDPYVPGAVQSEQGEATHCGEANTATDRWETDLGWPDAVCADYPAGDFAMGSPRSWRGACPG